jgi:hypothetical protein
VHRDTLAAPIANRPAQRPRFDGWTAVRKPRQDARDPCVSSGRTRTAMNALLVVIIALGAWVTLDLVLLALLMWQRPGRARLRSRRP